MPGVFIGSTEIVDVGKIKAGSTDVQEIYVGALKIWPPGGGGGPTPSFTWDPETNGPGTLPGGATFTRAGDAYEFTGTIFVLRSSGVIRDAHIAFSGGAPGYLAEPAATNQVTESSDYNTSWNLIGLTPTNDGVGSLGLTQHTLDAGTDNSNHRMFISAASAAEGCAYYIAKEGNINFCCVRRGGSNASDFAAYDINLGTVTQEGAGIEDALIVNYADGWFGCSVDTIDVSATTGFSLSLNGTPGSGGPTFTGSNETELCCHAQYENTRYPTSPIITNGSAQTRIADVLDSGETIAAAFSALFDFTAPAVIGPGNTISLLGAATSAVDILRLDENYNVIMDDGGTPTTIGTVAANQRFKVSYGRDGTDRSGSLDGATAVTGGAPSSSHESETFQLYSTASVNQARGVGHLVNLYATRLSDGELESISS